ncbi:TetR/AcrR family transcriptional regulator [Guptibacillus algicola]|uniref:TetR/AcrR family transcriptional regulator n=1 Tax=Guptibacillus algicola TaxID=225844 RepID=UPI001CD6E989|nr:TetR/AcrR family transcriptional regulator [Alkalihalobacillus algicola]MCA0989164.1 TetR/AcrR family transcriptional regulator [Alkalihalobacillus algicola]
MGFDRKVSIINAAEKSFSMFGYKATTMDQVAKIANVGKGTIYTFFKNKEELFNEIVSQMVGEMKELAETSIREEDSFFENLHRALFDVLEHRKEHKLAIKLSQEVREIGTPAALEALNLVEQAITSFIKQEIERGVRNNEIKECDPSLTAFLLFKMYIALVFDWEKTNRSLTKEEIAHHLELFTMEGIKKP